MIITHGACSRCVKHHKEMHVFWLANWPDTRLALNPEKLDIPWPVFRAWVVRVLARAMFRINTCTMVDTWCKWNRVTPRRMRTALLHWYRLHWMLPTATVLSRLEEVSIRHLQRRVLHQYPGGCRAAQVAKHVCRCYQGSTAHECTLETSQRSRTGYILFGTFLFSLRLSNF
ncbi:hypothetical protein B0H14DRAFT_2935402 [Mycena olivaceomarginata]|nr:hypothetical protein B0H14DRAFT_2935402 [Mycena olivaceomarginata]